VTAPRELAHFKLLTADEQLATVKRLAAQGLSDATIATITRLGVDDVRRLLAEPTVKLPG
jgi:hypothetical protein